MNNINLGTSQSRGYEDVNLEVKGAQEFLGKEIPIIYGGFGSNQKVVLAKTIAEIHEVETKYINKLINNNQNRFKDGIDVIDLKTGSSKELVLRLGFTNAQWGNAKNIYLLSERGYVKLIKIMDSDLAWDIHEQLVDEYFLMREEKEKQKPVSQLDAIIAGLQATKELQEKMAVVEQVQVQQEKAIQNIRNVVAINTTDWRKDTTIIINKISATLDGDYQFVRNKSYELLEQRAKCKLSVRQTNLKRQMLENGCSKSKVDKVSKLDVIDNDNRLKEIYIAVVKEMAIKYNVA